MNLLFLVDLFLVSFLLVDLLMVDLLLMSFLLRSFLLMDFLMVGLLLMSLRVLMLGCRPDLNQETHTTPEVVEGALVTAAADTIPWSVKGTDR
jgi:hypothetical protein